MGSRSAPQRATPQPPRVDRRVRAAVLPVSARVGAASAPGPPQLDLVEKGPVYRRSRGHRRAGHRGQDGATADCAQPSRGEEGPGKALGLHVARPEPRALAARLCSARTGSGVPKQPTPFQSLRFLQETHAPPSCPHPFRACEPVPFPKKRPVCGPALRPRQQAGDRQGGCRDPACIVCCWVLDLDTDSC